MPKQRAIFKPLPDSLPVGFWTELLLGKTVEEFAREILSNPGGKYDVCYCVTESSDCPSKAKIPER